MYIQPIPKRVLITFGLVFFKSQEADSQRLPTEGTVLITISQRERLAVLHVAEGFHKLGFQIKATERTHLFLKEHRIPSEHILKMHEGRPNIVEGIMNKEIGVDY